MKEYIIVITVGLYWKNLWARAVSLNQSKWRLGWSRGIVHMSNKRCPVFQECCLFIGRLCCHTGHTGQYSVVRSERAVFNSAHSFKHFALLRGMLYVNNTAYCAETLACLQGTWLLRKEGFDIWTWCIFWMNTSDFVGLLFLQKHNALLQRKVTLIKKGMLHFCFKYLLYLLVGMGIL